MQNGSRREPIRHNLLSIPSFPDFRDDPASSRLWFSDVYVVQGSSEVDEEEARSQKAPVKTKAVGKTIGAKRVNALKKQVREKSQSVETVAFSPAGPETRSGRQSGDLQGLSSVESADSESVGDLLEEG